MWTSQIHINKPGLLSMIQDGGRMGYQSYGIPVSGCMDKYAARLANLLVDNHQDQSIIEMNFSGAEIKVTGDIYIAITGADMNATVNGVKVPMYETLYVKDESILKFKSAENGARTYLAIAGKIETDEWLGSTSAYASINISSLQKNTFFKGTEIKVENSKMVNKKICPDNLRRPFLGEDPLRILPGPEHNWFDQKQIDFLSSNQFTIDQKSNRMATNLMESLPSYLAQQELISSATLPGTIQITNSGTPIILMREGGTTGGYPRIAKVFGSDINRLAQMRPGHRINFVFISYEEARAAMIHENQNWKRLSKHLSSKY